MNEEFEKTFSQFGVSELVKLMKESGLNPIESMKYLIQNHGFSYKHAMEVVYSHPVWDLSAGFNDGFNTEFFK